MAVGLLAFAIAQSLNMRLEVDARDVGRGVIHVVEEFTSPTPVGSITYPKWIPAHHRPVGPINDVLNFHVYDAGTEVRWKRDDVEMYSIHLARPLFDASVQFDYRFQPKTIGSPKLARVKWNRLLFYPQGVASAHLPVAASIRLPQSWSYATALPVASESADTVNFKSASLERLVDSPLLIGRNYRKIVVQQQPLHEIDLFADTVSGLKFPDKELPGYARLVQQAQAMMGPGHYRDYHWLLSVSDFGGGEGTEHGESSEDGTGAKAFDNRERLIRLATLLAHEYSHSWNGKFRRPIGLATTDFLAPEKTELLWVYEGLTEYLGELLPVRAGLVTEEEYRDRLAATAASLDHRYGRKWRPLSDTAVSVQLVRDAPSAGYSQRRGTDYYSEGVLLWLDVDMTIRRLSGGTKSLDDFCKSFFAGPRGQPEVHPYSYRELIEALNAVQPYDWNSFFQQRVYTVTEHPPMGGILASGWKLEYTDSKPAAGRRGSGSIMYTLGMSVSDEGEVRDINPETPAWDAGLSTGMKIKTVNASPWSMDRLRDAIRNSAQTNGIDLGVEYDGVHSTLHIVYRGGERQPVLIRDPSTLIYCQSC